jgi:hypothetical protein
LLRVAYDYLRAVIEPPALGICLCSSVAWGTATPASDIDLQIIVPDDRPVCREKREFSGEYVDHFEWQASEIQAAIETFTRDPLAQPVGSYSLAFSLILLDPTGELTSARDRLAPLISGRDGARRWIDHCLQLAGQRRAERRHAVNRGCREDPTDAAWECVHALADAVLHRVPGGHCGAWPHRLSQWAAESRQPWLIEDARAILMPGGVDLPALSPVTDCLETLHGRSATPPHGPGMGATAPNAGYFARKARFYAREEDALSALWVLKRQLGYVRSNIEAKRAAAVPSAPELAAELGRVEQRLQEAWPHHHVLDEAVLLDKLDSYFEQISRQLR